MFAGADKRRGRLLPAFTQVHGEFSEDEDDAQQPAPARPAPPALQQQQQQQQQPVATLAAPAAEQQIGQRPFAPQAAMLQAAAMQWMLLMSQGGAGPLVPPQMQQVPGLYQGFISMNRSGQQGGARPPSLPRMQLPTRPRQMMAAQHAYMPAWQQSDAQAMRPMRAARPAAAGSGVPSALQAARAEAGAGAGRRAGSAPSGEVAQAATQQQPADPQKRSREAAAPDGGRSEAEVQPEQGQARALVTDGGDGDDEPAPKRHRTEEGEASAAGNDRGGPAEPPPQQQPQLREPPHVAHAATSAAGPPGASLKPGLCSIIRRLTRPGQLGRTPPGSTGPSASQSRSLNSAAGGAGGSNLPPQQQGQVPAAGQAAHEAAAPGQAPASKQEPASSERHTPLLERERRISSDSMLGPVAGSGGTRDPRLADLRAAKRARATPQLQLNPAALSPTPKTAEPPADDIIDLTGIAD